jgi:hypothetical protein
VEYKKEDIDLSNAMNNRAVQIGRGGELIRHALWTIYDEVLEIVTLKYKRAIMVISSTTTKN